MMRELDQFDIAILDIIQEDGKVTRRELSERIGLSATPCHDRIKRLEKEKYISRYAARIDINKVIKSSIIYTIITLKRHRSADFDIFERAVRECNEVVECYGLGGSIDYLLKVVVSNMEEYQIFMDKLVAEKIGIADYYTHNVTKPVIEFKGFPLKKLLS